MMRVWVRLSQLPKICASGVPTGNGELAKSQFSKSSTANYDIYFYGGNAAQITQFSHHSTGYFWAEREKKKGERKGL
jgi:hypothetical protein